MDKRKVGNQFNDHGVPNGVAVSKLGCSTPMDLIFWVWMSYNIWITFAIGVQGYNFDVEVKGWFTTWSI